MREIGPAPVSRAVYLALRALPPEATALARALAVLGDGAPLTQLARLARVSDEDAAEAVAALAFASLLADGEGGVAFAHPILGRAIYEELEAGERAAAHRRRCASCAPPTRPPSASRRTRSRRARAAPRS